jgi:hypothetical protein
MIGRRPDPFYIPFAAEPSAKRALREQQLQDEIIRAKTCSLTDCLAVLRDNEGSGDPRTIMLTRVVLAMLDGELERAAS